MNARKPLTSGLSKSQVHNIAQYIQKTAVDFAAKREIISQQNTFLQTLYVLCFSYGWKAKRIDGFIKALQAQKLVNDSYHDEKVLAEKLVSDLEREGIFVRENFAELLENEEAQYDFMTEKERFLRAKKQKG